MHQLFFFIHSLAKTDGFLIVFHKWLLEQHPFAVEIPQPASTILAMVFSGLPSWRAASARISRSLATTAGSSSSLLTAYGRMAAVCMAISFTTSALPPSNSIRTPLAAL